MIKELRNFEQRPTILTNNKRDSGIKSELNELLDKQNQLLKQIFGSKKKKKSFKGVSDRYEARIKLLEENHFKNQEIIDLQKQLLTFKQVKEEPKNYYNPYNYNNSSIF